MSSFVISIIGDKGGLGKTTLGYNLFYRVLKDESAAALIDCDDEQHSSYDFSQLRKRSGLSEMPVYNIDPKNLEDELLRLSKLGVKLFIIEFGKSGKKDDKIDQEKRRLAVKVANLVISPIPVSPIDAMQIEKFEDKLPPEISNVPAIMIPNRVKSMGQLESLRAAEPTFRYFKLSKTFLADRLIYQDCFGKEGRSIYEMRPRSNSDREGIKEFEQLYKEFFYE